MSQGFQKVILLGNLGRDPDSRENENGEAWCVFNIAVNEGKYGTKWFSIFTSGTTAEACGKYLRTGSQVLVEGTLRGDPETGGPKLWTRNDGSSGASFEVQAFRVVFTSGSRKGEEYVEETDDFPF